VSYGGTICNLSQSGGRSKRTVSSNPAQEKLVRLYLKNKIQNKRADGVAQVVECLPSMCEALDLILSTEEENNK
jgi:hypothetical protein